MIDFEEKTRQLREIVDELQSCLEAGRGWAECQDSKRLMNRAGHIVRSLERIVWDLEWSQSSDIERARRVAFDRAVAQLGS